MGLRRTHGGYRQGAYGGKGIFRLQWERVVMHGWSFLAPQWSHFGPGQWEGKSGGPKELVGLKELAGPRGQEEEVFTWIPLGGLFPPSHGGPGGGGREGEVREAWRSELPDALFTGSARKKRSVLGVQRLLL